MMNTRSSKKWPQVPGGPSFSSGTDGSRPRTGTRGAKNLRVASISRQTTSAMNMDTEEASDTSITSTRSLFESPRSSLHSYECLSNCSSPTSTSSQITCDVEQEANSHQLAPIIGKNQRTRQKWNMEMYKFIWRTYLLITQLETKKRYMTELHLQFKAKYNHIQVTKQKIGEIKRAIIRDKLLEDDTLHDIREEVKNILKSDSQILNTTQITHINRIDNNIHIIESSSCLHNTLNITEEPTTNRRTWTEEMNKFIYRNYLIITKLDTSRQGYLEPLHNQFLQKFPDMNVSRQRLGDQYRAIIRNKLLPTTVLNEIKAEVTANLNSLTQDLIIPNSTLQPGRRMRWTTEHNEAIMRSYFRVTNLETNLTMYRTTMYREFIKTFPHLAEHVTEQRVADQRRLIINNKGRYITEKRLNEIKQEVNKELQSQQRRSNKSIAQNQTEMVHEYTLSSNIETQTPDTEQDLTQSNNIETFNHSEPETNHNVNTNINAQINLTDQQDEVTITDHDQCSDINNTFNTALKYFLQLEPTKRQYIPKQKTSKKLASIVNYINTKILPIHIKSDTTYDTFQTILYSAAWTAAKLNGSKITIPSGTQTRNSYTHRKPKWQIRLEKKIEDLRAKIGRLTQYIRGHRNTKLSNHVHNILAYYKIHTTHEDPNTELNQFLDTLKQKLAVACSRLKRYKTCSQRKNQNNQFNNNEKQFYRTLKATTTNQGQQATATYTCKHI
ncbi:unnamed protein product [Colias eurytheme]|nr:unnamed protein product [Colias eurytheme]